jgi:predicted membrane protein
LTLVLIFNFIFAFKTTLIILLYSLFFLCYIYIYIYIYIKISNYPSAADDNKKIHCEKYKNSTYNLEIRKNRNWPGNPHYSGGMYVGSSSYQNQVFVLVFGVIHHSFRVLA